MIAYFGSPQADKGKLLFQQKIDPPILAADAV